MSRTFSSCARESSANGYARRTSSCTSSTEISSSAQIATTCCASTSSGFRGMRVSSIVAVAHRTRDDRRLEEVGPVLGEDPALRDRVRARAPRGRRAAVHARPTSGSRPGSRGRRRPCRCRARATRSRRGTGSARLQELLDDEPLLARQRAVVRPRELLARELVDPEREALGEPAVVDEDDGRPVLTDELEDRRVDRRPDRAARPLDSDAHLDAVGHDAARTAPRSRAARACPRRERRPARSSSFRTPASTSSISRPLPATKRPISSMRPLRRRERRRAGTGARRGARAARATARGALRASSPRPRAPRRGHCLDPAQRLARLRGEEQEERLGGRDEDVRRRPQHPPSLVGRRVAGAHGDRELRAEPRERAAEVPLDVVVERLQRRDVEEPEPLARRLVQSVDAEEERRERLPRAGRRLDEHVPAPRDRRPPELLRRRRRSRTPARTTSSCAARGRRGQPFAQGIRPRLPSEACPRRSTSPIRTRRTD